jgi:hypothetical protein
MTIFEGVFGCAFPSSVLSEGASSRALKLRPSSDISSALDSARLGDTAGFRSLGSSNLQRECGTAAAL